MRRFGPIMIRLVALALLVATARTLVYGYRGDFPSLFDRVAGQSYFVYRGNFYVYKDPLYCPSPERFHWCERSMSGMDEMSVRFSLSVWWVIVLLLAWISYLFFWPAVRRRRRLSKGLCGRCAYDLRGLSVPRCPECAKPFDMNRLRKVLDRLDEGER